MNFDKKYREWQDWPECITSTSDISINSKKVSFYREKDSHKGISEFKLIKKLLAKQVNQEFLNEISKLESLEYLEIEILTAEDLTPLTNLKKLRTLKLEGIRKANEFSFLEKMESLTKLFIENAKNISNLSFLSKAHNLVAIGLEGGMYTKQKIDSLEPISCLNKLEALFMSSVQLKDKNLDYLATIPNLKYLGAARFAPKSSFESLRKNMPKLSCNWCDNYDV